MATGEVKMAETPQWVLDEIQRVKDEGLTELDLNKDYETERLTHIPDEIFELRQLTVLNLGEHPLQDNIPSELSQLTNLTLLALDGKYGGIPESVRQLTNLKHLYLLGNYSSIPDWISELSHLTLLYLSGRYNSIPESISQLTNLKQLVLRGDYNSAPESISQLINLTQLDLFGDYNSIPESISQLINLTQLSLHGNYEHIPREIGNLTQLTQLSLHGNYEHIPREIGNLTQLTQLYLSGDYERIPHEIGNLTQLFKLYLHSRIEIISPPPEVMRDQLSPDIDAIRQYFNDLKNEATIPLYEAKLLIVGEPNVGKTTLATKLIDINAPMPDPNLTTIGIEIEPWRFELSNGETFRVNIWDFGGQEIYKATHQFFLTKDSVYVLVLDNRRDEDNLIYWLQAIEVLGENSPVLIVKNERSQRVRQLNERQLIERFSNIRGIRNANLATNQGISAIKETVMRNMQELPHFGIPLPQSWANVRRALENDHRNYVTHREYLAICSNNDLNDRAKAETILGYLHNLGICLYFEDDDLLSRYVILRPDWATQAVYAVLDNNNVITNYGVFTKDDLTQLWQDDYADMIPMLLNLMKKFQLCYAIDDSTYIAPQLLADRQPDYEWDSRDNLMLRYSYDFMPKGIVSRLIVAMHDLIDKELKWKSGVILRHNTARAEIKQNYRHNQIIIRTSGFNKDSLLMIVTYEIEKLHRTFGHKLMVTKDVPCKCNICINDSVPEYYEYSLLEELAKQADTRLRCLRSLEFIDAKVLIKDIVAVNFSKTDLEERTQVAAISLNRLTQDHKIRIQQKEIQGLETQLRGTRHLLNQTQYNYRRNLFRVFISILAIIVEAIILLVPSQIEWVWFATHPNQLAVYILATIIWGCIVWMMVDRVNRANVAILVITIIITVISPEILSVR